jgi:hypothetical protein
MNEVLRLDPANADAMTAKTDFESRVAVPVGNK